MDTMLDQLKEAGAIIKEAEAQVSLAKSIWRCAVKPCKYSMVGIFEQDSNIIGCSYGQEDPFCYVDNCPLLK